MAQEQPARDQPAGEQPARNSRRRFLGSIAATAAVATTGIGAVSPDTAAQDAETGGTEGLEGRVRDVMRVRADAAGLATATDPPVQVVNGDERPDISYALSFTKGLPHDYDTGLVRRNRDFELFVAALESGDRDALRDVPFGPVGDFRTAPADSRRRGWETPAAGLCFNLVGHDPQSLTMPPPPKAGSHELVAEMAEVYAQAALRDVPLTTLRHDAAPNTARDRMIGALSELPWFDASTVVAGLSEAARARRRTDLSPQTAFRGLTPGETVGPYLSQLLLVGSTSPTRRPFEGIIDYGAQTIDQRVRQVAPVDFMASWDEWFDVANALAPASGEPDTGNRRFITTARDLATYVHVDAVYQAYLAACLVLVTNGFGLDPSLPYQERDSRDHQQGFVLFSMQHVLTMLGEVSDRALRTVFFQKFNVHRRLRPEELAARIDKSDVLEMPEIARMARRLGDAPFGDEIRRMTRSISGDESLLLPMAFAEGSPMHPSYGAGHATVAGACVTILKTFFDHTQPFDVAGAASRAFVPTVDGSQLALVDVLDAAGDPAALTVEGELNKLAANIAIGRNWAGVHYFTDYWESLLLGEQVAIEFLREHLLALPESPSLRVPRFDGSRLWL